MPPTSDRLLADKTLDRLRAVSVATVTMQLLKRGLRHTFIQGPRPLNPQHARFAAEAYTLRTIPMREDLSTPEVLADPEYPQRKAIEACPPGHVLVCDCRGEQRAGALGDILITRLMVRGVAAFVTDGPMRDAAAVAAIEFPTFCTGSAAPASLAAHFAVAVQDPIACGGVAVFPGDVSRPRRRRARSDRLPASRCSLATCWSAIRTVCASFRAASPTTWPATPASRN